MLGALGEIRRHRLRNHIISLVSSNTVDVDGVGILRSHDSVALDAACTIASMPAFSASGRPGHRSTIV